MKTTQKQKNSKAVSGSRAIAEGKPVKAASSAPVPKESASGYGKIGGQGKAKEGKYLDRFTQKNMLQRKGAVIICARRLENGWKMSDRKGEKKE